MLKKYLLLLIILLSACADNTNNSEQKSEELGAPNQNDDLKYLAQDFREKIYSPHENIKVAVGYGLANSILVLGNTQSLVVDTMGGIETANRVIDDLDIPSNKPVITGLFEGISKSSITLFAVSIPPMVSTTRL